MEDVALSPEYQAANKAHSEAFKRYVPIRDAYRAGNLDDHTFIAAQKQYYDALAEWELAFEKERDQ
jgi:cellulose biosynthesis protein BcsQ